VTLTSDFLLVHGAWHDASCWQPLVPLLVAKGHRVHTPHLPGHGPDADTVRRLTLDTYCDHVTACLDGLSDPAILVGHSMAGMVISAVAERIPDRVKRLVYLSAYLPCDGESLFDVIANNRQKKAPAMIESVMQLTPDKRQAVIPDAQIRPLFYQRCLPAFDKHLPTTFPPQATLTLSARVAISPNRFGKVPKTYICCLDDKVIPVAHQRNMLTRQACDEMIQLDADHSPFYSCPDTLAAVLHSISLDD